MKRVKQFLSVLIVMGCVRAGGVASASTYYVATNGSDARSCSQAQSSSSPKGTLNNAVLCLTPGDTLYVRGGVYNESLLMTVPSGTSWSNKVTVAAYPGESVTMRPSSGDFVLQFAGGSNYGHSGSQMYIEFNGINLDGTSVTYDVVKIEAGPGYNAHHIRIKNATLTAVYQYPGHVNAQVVLITGLSTDSIGFNEFQNLTLTGGGPVVVGNDFSVMFYIMTPDNLIENCIIENGIGAGIQIYNSNQPGSVPDRTIVRNNIIRNFTTSLGARGYGIIAGRGTGHQIYNNLIYNIANIGGVSSGIYLYSGSNSEVYNNTVYGNALYGILVEVYTSGASVRNNISYRNGVANIVDYGSGTSVSNNLTTDPHFTNAAGGDFTLRSDSAAIDRGTYLSSVTNDLAGGSRPQGAGYDIGAYEYGSGGSSAASSSDSSSAPSTPSAPASGASADATRIPGASQIVDNSMSVWTLGSGGQILRNGVQAAGGYGSQILWYQGNIYVIGDDSRYWRWTGSTWALYGSSDPAGGASASSSSSSSSSPSPSASGTSVPSSSSLTDNSLNVWTLGSGQQILRNGSQVLGGYGSQILFYKNVIFVVGDDSLWWKWTGVTWALYGASTPSY